MATHRSLNKLEFRAHMSIHNFKDVEEGEVHEFSRSTRDRFGKTHRLNNEDGSSRLRRSKNTAILITLLSLSSFFTTAVSFAGDAASSEGLSASDSLSARSNTNIRVETEGLDAHSWLNQKGEPEEKFGIPLNDSSAVGFNEDGDPSMSTRF